MVDNLAARMDVQATRSPVAGGGLVQAIAARLRAEATVIHRLHGLSGKPKPPLMSRGRRALISKLMRLLC